MFIKKAIIRNINVKVGSTFINNASIYIYIYIYMYMYMYVYIYIYIQKML
jgi:hypothetical protein